MENETVDRYELEAEFYDKIYDYKEDIPLYLEYSKNVKGAVLECGCGTGRILLPLAREGIKVVGIDTSKKMLAVARRKIAEESEEVRSRIKLVEADMRNFELEERFSLCIIAFSTFLHLLTVEDQERTLRCIHKHLLPDGKVIISVFNPDLSRPQNLVRLDKIKHVDNEIIMRFTMQKFDFPNQLMDVWHIYDFVKLDGTVKRHVVYFKLRYIFYNEMIELLKRTGYEIEAVYGDHKKTPFNEKSPLMVFVARRKK